MSQPALLGAVSRAVGSSVTRVTTQCGDVQSGTHRFELADGRTLFVKTHPAGTPMFEPEAEGLRWLATFGALKVASVVAVGTAEVPFLALRFEPPTDKAQDYDEQLGRGLAQLHAHGAPHFGWHHANFVGALPQDNEPCSRWPEFYGNRRLEPLITRGRQLGLLPQTTTHRLEGVMDRLEALCHGDEPPAPLHGDLWAGNVLCDAEGGPLLTDPACYGGHREIDLAMMRLFGGFSQRCFDAYAETYPLAPGYAQRVPLYQLYPLLVHVHLFGSSYVRQLDEAARAVR